MRLTLLVSDELRDILRVFAHFVEYDIKVEANEGAWLDSKALTQNKGFG